MKILVVDDKPDNVELLSQILEDDYDVISAYNGADCIELAKEQHPDLILLDVMMPILNGYDVLEILQEDESTSDIPVIFLTAEYNDTDRIDRGLETGAVDYITKPIQDEVLLARIRSVIRIKKAEDEVSEHKISLKEKEVLLSEIHHRVKNNMQIIISMLRLQSGLTEDKIVLDILSESQDRIHAMALVHDQLYESKNLATINFNDYISKLAGGLIYSYRERTSTVTMNVEVASILLDVSTIIPIGLIVNEMVTNTMKYAFPLKDLSEERKIVPPQAVSEKRANEIKIALKQTEIKGEYELLVSDNGVGIPEGIDIRTAKTLGLRLITMLAERQLSGKMELNRDKGTEYRIKFFCNK